MDTDRGEKAGRQDTITRCFELVDVALSCSFPGSSMFVLSFLAPKLLKGHQPYLSHSRPAVQA